ncbi:hypothetical protein NDA11_005056 [Ustilago hordei]|uniref:Uncharacterized protein n=1 Tax=Ustilago hordei TaxID=120017 RepID=I2FUR6_USTHO|nr:hypothetical protein NDA10_007797 [Ustilago hordei]KAJ1576526.1 hypothetical protein NDA12_006809 [Ustilago hordei]KAJ1577942.1 hypothetical protein NDA15_007569 [Ustilago hordei]KAJ1596510.1 hypothetical protein NDA11_005056 [Ustilago hordei]KAJ1598784.1 hypothetical protein NDA14_001370 [Ustilago hordei]
MTEQTSSWVGVVESPHNLTTLQEAGKGDREGHSNNLPVPCSESCGLLELLKNGSEQGEGNRELGLCWSKAVSAFDALDSLLQTAMREGAKGETKVNVPGTEAIELVFDAVEWLGPGHVTDPFGEEQVQSWEGGYPRPKLAANEGLVPVWNAHAALAAGFGQASPDVSGGKGQTTHGINKGLWDSVGLVGKRS